MGLEKEHNEYFEKLASDRRHLVLKRFQEERERLGFCYDEVQQQLNGQMFVNHIHKLAKELIDSRASSYLETCTHFKIFPNDSDLRKFVDDSKPYITNLDKLLEDFYRSPWPCPSIPVVIQESTLRVLKHSLQDIFRIGLYPVEQLYMEGRVVERNNLDAEETNMQESSKAGLTPDQLIWLETRYERQQNGESISNQGLLVALHGKIQADFDPDKISRSLMTKKKVTALGIALVDPEAEIVKSTNRTIDAIRKFLRENPDVSRVTAKELSKISGVDERETELIIEDIAHWPSIFHGSGISAGKVGWLAFNNETSVLRDYLKYENLQMVIDEMSKSRTTEIVTAPILDPKTVYNHFGDNIGGHKIKMGGNIGGNQTFAEDSPIVSINPDSPPTRSRWLRGDVIAIVGIVAAIIMFLLGYPTFKTWTCERWQVLCEQSTPQRSNP